MLFTEFVSQLHFIFSHSLTFYLVCFSSYSTQISYYFGIYGLLSTICVGFSMISVPCGQYAGSKARRSLHDRLLHSIVQKSIYFFQTTPFGRMMNRFSSDMAVIDKVNSLWKSTMDAVKLPFYPRFFFHRQHFIDRFELLFVFVCYLIENCSNKSTAPSICTAVFVLHFIECFRYTVVHLTDVTHSLVLLYSAEILSLFIEVIFIEQFPSSEEFSQRASSDLSISNSLLIYFIDLVFLKWF